MLRTRLWMGTLLIGLGVLLLVRRPLVCPVVPDPVRLFRRGQSSCRLASFSCFCRTDVRPSEALTLGFVALMACLNWWPAFQTTRELPWGLGVAHLHWFVRRMRNGCSRSFWRCGGFASREVDHTPRRSDGASL